MPYSATDARVRIVLVIILVSLIGVGFPWMARTGSYSGSTLVSLPLCVGIVLALLLSLGKPLKTSGLLIRVSLVVVVFVLIGLSLMGFRGEGSICLLVFGLIIILPYLAGVWIGFAIQKYLWSFRVVLVGLAVVLLSATSSKPVYHPLHSTEDRLRVAAPAARVWQVLNGPVSFGASTDFWFRNGVSYPLSMQLRIAPDGNRVLLCCYNNGTAQGQVFNYEPPYRFSFRFADSLAMMKEQNLFGETRTMHITHHLQLVEGSFTVLPINATTCELRAASVYRHKLWPVNYYNFWFDHVFHQLHHHVLQRISQQAVESSGN